MARGRGNEPWTPACQRSHDGRACNYAEHAAARGGQDMAERKLGCLPVVRNERLVGI